MLIFDNDETAAWQPIQNCKNDQSLSDIVRNEQQFQTEFLDLNLKQ